MVSRSRFSPLMLLSTTLRMERMSTRKLVHSVVVSSSYSNFAESRPFFLETLLVPSEIILIEIKLPLFELTLIRGLL